MDSDTILALSGLMSLAVAVLTGALWGMPVVTTAFRWFLN
jgi:hypothetical protein